MEMWWLLTYRAKLKFHKELDIPNKIVYYIPKKYVSTSEGKIEFMGNLGIDMEIIDKTKYEFYNYIIDRFEK